MIEVVNPATEEVIGTLAEGTPADVDVAVAAAVAAFPAWAQTSVDERVKVVRTIIDGLRACAGELAATMTREMGTPLTFSQKVQVANPVAIAEGVADVLERGYFEPEEIGNSLVFREPIGVVRRPSRRGTSRCSRWWRRWCRRWPPGNTVVLKPSELAPGTADLLAEIVAAAVPAECSSSSTAPGRSSVRRWPRIRTWTWCRSPGPRRPGAGCRLSPPQTVKRVALELGGKSACIVLDDADLGRAVKIAVANSFMNNGQACSAWTRLLVPRGPARRGRASWPLRLRRSTRRRSGASRRRGSGRRCRRHSATVSSATSARVSRKARRLPRVGRKRRCRRGSTSRPTVFGGVTPEMTIAQEEIFGPVLSVMPYADEDDAVRIANSTIYGLAGGVFSADTDRALRVARRLRTGQVDINAAAFNTSAPFGGYRQSGNGREFGRFGLDEFCEVKSVQR